MNEFETWLSEFKNKDEAIELHRLVITLENKGFGEPFCYTTLGGYQLLSKEKEPNLLYIIFDNGENFRRFEINSGRVTLDKAIIQHFIKDTEYAQKYLDSVIEDGNEYEIKQVREWKGKADNWITKRTRQLRRV